MSDIDKRGSLKVKLPSWRALAVMSVPISAALGPYLLPVEVFGISIYAYRFLVLFLLLLSLLRAPKIAWWSNPVARFYLLLGGFWTLWGLTSVFWAPDPNAAIRDVLAVAFGFGVGLVFLDLKSYTAEGLDVLRRGWLLAYVVTAVIAIWEKLTGNHLSSFFTENTPEYVLTEIVVSTFGNPNNYGAFLLLSLPFLLWSFSTGKRTTYRLFCMGLLISLPVFLILSASRVALLGLAVQFLAYGFLSIRRRRSLTTFLGIVAAFSLLVGWLLQHDILVVRKLALLFGDELRLGGSITGRLNLALTGLWFAYISGGWGIGAGGFEYMVRSGSTPFRTGRIFSPHNFWIEVLSQYGIPVFIAVVLWIVYLARVALRARRVSMVHGCVSSRVLAETALVGWVGYLFAAVTSSIYLVQPTSWMFLGSVLVMVTYLWDEWACMRTL